MQGQILYLAQIHASQTENVYYRNSWSVLTSYLHFNFTHL